MNSFRAERNFLPKLSDRLSLGNKGLKVSPFCLGLVGSEQTASAAFEAGINFFFLTTDMHWPLYETARKGLSELLKKPGVRDDVVVAAACYPTQPEFCSAPFFELVEAVAGLKRIDVLVAGGAYEVEFAGRHPVYKANAASGYVGNKAIGASFHDRKLAARQVNENGVDIAYIRYNPVHRGAESDLFPFLQSSPTLLYNFKSTMGYMSPEQLARFAYDKDQWYPDPSDYYRFALSRHEIDGLLIATRFPSEVEALAEAMSRGPLSEEEQLAFEKIAKIYLSDLWLRKQSGQQGMLPDLRSLDLKSSQD